MTFQAHWTWNTFQTFLKIYVNQTKKVKEGTILLLIISSFLIIFMKIYKSADQFQAEKEKAEQMCKTEEEKASSST